MELQIGFWVLVAFALLLWATFQSGNIKFFSPEDRITLVFLSVPGFEESYTQLVEVSGSARVLTARLNENQSKVSIQFLSLAANLDTLVQKMEKGNGSMALLLNDATLHQKLTSSTARADSILGAIAAGKGTFGRLYADSTLYDDTKALMASMKRLMAEIEKNPKKYFKFSIF